MPEQYLTPQIYIDILKTPLAEKRMLRRIVLLSVLFHIAALVAMIAWTEGRARLHRPVQVIALDLANDEPPRPQLAPAAVPRQPRSSPPPVLAAPAPAVSHQPEALAPVSPASDAAAVQPGPAVPAAPPIATARPGDLADSQTAGTVASARVSYIQRCRLLIERNKEYPLLARKGGLEGTVVIRGVLTRDGSLRQCSVNRSSGSSMLDNAAVRAVKRVGQFPPAPPELHGEELVFELPISFRLSAN